MRWARVLMNLGMVGLIVTLTLGLLAAPLPADAQQAQVRRIGLLTPRSPSDSALWFQAFRQGLRDLGWVEGTNISIAYRYAQGKLARLPDLAAELLRLKVEMVVVQSGWAVDAVQRVSKAMPIVMAAVADPVGTGTVQSLARPGGNITGLTEMIPELSGKRLELLKETNRHSSATRPCGSIGIGGSHASMKCCLSSSGCETRPAKGEPPRPVARLAPVAEMASAMHRQANVRAVGLRPRNLSSFRMPRVLEYSEGNNGLLHERGEEGAVSGGVFDHSTSEEDGLATWEALASPRRHSGVAESR